MRHRAGRLALVALLACAETAPPELPPASSPPTSPPSSPPTSPGADPPGPGRTGVLTIEQLDLCGLSLGEAAVVVGPDGTSVLIDVGNDGHADTVREAVLRLTGEAAVDWVILTHFHADHIGGFEGLGLTVRRGVISRGWVDLEHANLDELDALRAALEPSLHRPLCAATTCPGVGTRLELGQGAVLELDLANGYAAPTTRLLDPGEEENARSLAGTIAWGDFRYRFSGDLTGGGKDTPDLEGALVGFGAVQPADVVHLNHHGIRSSSSRRWLEALMPADGRPRHAIVGANGLYLAAPHQDVLDAVVPRLGGGRVWVTEDGRLAGASPALCVAGGPVTVRVEPERYTVEAGACGRAEVVLDPG